MVGAEADAVHQPPRPHPAPRQTPRHNSSCIWATTFDLHFDANCSRKPINQGVRTSPLPFDSLLTHASPKSCRSAVMSSTDAVFILP